MARWLVMFWFVLGTFPWSAGAAEIDGLVAIPRLEARVTDLTATLTHEQQAQLESALAAIEGEKGAQVAILLMPSVQPETIEQFGIRLAEAWQIGRRGVNDGVIVMVAKADRKVRIEVGYGLEGAIPDALAQRIITEIITPYFKQGDFFGGLNGAVAALGKLIAGESLPDATKSGAGQADGDELPLLVFIVIMLAGWMRKLLGLLGALLAAGLAGGLMFTFSSSWLAAGVMALLAFAFSFGRIGGGGKGGWHSGGGGGFSSSGSGGSGNPGGFSGGGGSFGGGGSSGSW